MANTDKTLCDVITCLARDPVSGPVEAGAGADLALMTAAAPVVALAAVFIAAFLVAWSFVRPA